MKTFPANVVAPGSLGLLGHNGATHSELNIDGVHLYATPRSKSPASPVQLICAAHEWGTYQGSLHLVERSAAWAGYPDWNLPWQAPLSRGKPLPCSRLPGTGVTMWTMNPAGLMKEL